jgi:hypothetical protein
LPTQILTSGISKRLQQYGRSIVAVQYEIVNSIVYAMYCNNTFAIVLAAILFYY